ncbi:unnamed protein product [Lasius platythorax]|uniref:Uncharacterized protein n=1 Tax=Lasius platythorax TaxID=488582 RepID=A0AAV2N0F1_9HYME
MEPHAEVTGSFEITMKQTDARQFGVTLSSMSGMSLIRFLHTALLLSTLDGRAGRSFALAAGVAVPYRPRSR